MVDFCALKKTKAWMVLAWENSLLKKPFFRGSLLIVKVKIFDKWLSHNLVIS